MTPEQRLQFINPKLAEVLTRIEGALRAHSRRAQSAEVTLAAIKTIVRQVRTEEAKGYRAKVTKLTRKER